MENEEEKKCAFEVSLNKCSVLTTKNCAKCSFFKDKSELFDGRERASERLQGLKNGKQLTEKYYKGKEI